MILKVDVLLPSTSQYHVLHHFAKKLYEAFIRQGMNCRLLSGDERLYATLRSPPDFTIGFNGAIKMEDGSLFCDHIQVPHVSCLVDPPYRFLELTQSPFVMITCDDEIGCDLLKKRNFDQTLFMPHAVEPELTFDPKIERIYDIAFLGTCIDGEKRKKNWKKLFPQKIVHLMEETSEQVLADETTSFMTPLLKELDPANYQNVYEEVELYIKAIDRLRLIKAFPEHTVHLFGASVDKTDWKKLLKKQPNTIIHPPVSYEQALDIMKQTKIILNSSIKNKQGAHERIFTAAACGAVVVTNDNLFLRKSFKSEKEIVFYNPQNFHRVNQQVSDLLENEDKRVCVAAACRKKVMAEHTWDHRVASLLRKIPSFLLR